MENPSILDMENLNLLDMLRLLEEEATMLTQMNKKISNELHCLQVEEEMFMRTLEKLGIAKQSTKKTGEIDGEMGKDNKLVEALRETLTGDGKGVSSEDLNQSGQISGSLTVETRELPSDDIKTTSAL